MAENEDDFRQPGTYAELRARSKDEVIAEYDRRKDRMAFFDPTFWLHEIYRRDAEEVNNAMLRAAANTERLTKVITWLTVANVVLTAVAVVATFGN